MTIGAGGGSPTTLWDSIAHVATIGVNFNYNIFTKRIVYTGGQPLCAQVNARVCMAMVGGPTRTCSVQVYLNGTGLLDTLSSQQVSASSRSSGALITINDVDLVNGDTIEAKLQQIETGAPSDNILIFSASFSILGYTLS